MPNSFADAEKNYEHGFAMFWMPDGEIRHIRTKYAFVFISEAMSQPREQWSKGAQTVATAVKSRGVGKMLELVHGVIDPLPTKQNYQELFDSLHTPEPKAGQ